MLSISSLPRGIFGTARFFSGKWISRCHFPNAIIANHSGFSLPALCPVFPSLLGNSHVRGVLTHRPSKAESFSISASRHLDNRYFLDTVTVRYHLESHSILQTYVSRLRQHPLVICESLLLFRCGNRRGEHRSLYFHSQSSDQTANSSNSIEIVAHVISRRHTNVIARISSSILRYVPLDSCPGAFERAARIRATSSASSSHGSRRRSRGQDSIARSIAGPPSVD